MQENLFLHWRKTFVAKRSVVPWPGTPKLGELGASPPLFLSCSKEWIQARDNKHSESEVAGSFVKCTWQEPVLLHPASLSAPPAGVSGLLLAASLQASPPRPSPNLGINIHFQRLHWPDRENGTQTFKGSPPAAGLSCDLWKSYLTPLRTAELLGGACPHPPPCLGLLSILLSSAENEKPCSAWNSMKSPPGWKPHGTLLPRSETTPLSSHRQHADWGLKNNDNDKISPSCKDWRVS